MNGENVSDATESRTAGQPLSDFLQQLEDYTPTVIEDENFIFSYFFSN